VKLQAGASARDQTRGEYEIPIGAERAVVPQLLAAVSVGVSCVQNVTLCKKISDVHAASVALSSRVSGRYHLGIGRTPSRKCLSISRFCHRPKFWPTASISCS
jgi:hypothetical protein